MIAGSLYALGFAANFLELGHLYGTAFPVGVPTLAIGVVAVFVGINALSTRASGGAETVVTVVKIAILLAFVWFGLSVVDPGEFEPLFEHGRPALLPAMGFTFIAFQGYDLIATVTEEVENPRKNIPRAIFLSLATTVVIYLLVVYVAVGTVGAETLGQAGETAIARAAAAFMPVVPVLGTGAALIAVGAVFSTVSVLNAVILASSRVAFAMGREGLLPARVGSTHHLFGTPLNAVGLSAVVILGGAAFVPLDWAANLASLFFLLSFVVVNASVVRLRQVKPNLSRPFRVPLYPVTPLLGIVLNLVFGFFIAPRVWLLGLGWLAVGGALYWVYVRRSRGRRREAAPKPVRAEDIDIEAIRHRAIRELVALESDVADLRDIQATLDAALEIRDEGRLDRTDEERIMDRLVEERDRNE